MEGGTLADDRQAVRSDPGNDGQAVVASSGWRTLGQGREAADVQAPRPQCSVVQTSQINLEVF
jgi:hypothetical protein